MYIYTMENLATGKRYVGQTHRPQDREKAHRSGKCGCIALQNAVNKYGEESFNFIVIEKCLNQGQLDEREEYWIAALSTKIPHGYNIKTGGAGGGPCDEKTKHKISIANKGKKRTSEQIENIRQAQIGKKLSEEHKAKLRVINLGKKMPRDAVEKTRQFWIGRKHSEEAKWKMSESHKGFKHTKQSKEKIGKALKGRVYSSETLLKMTEAAQERVRKGLSRQECKHGHKMTKENTYMPPGKANQRQCRSCLRINSAASRLRRGQS